MKYEGNVFRPPSEAMSLIIQVTIGCAHNECTFCRMYKDKSFRIRSKEEIFDDLDEMSYLYGNRRLRIFLADGDALIIPTDFLLDILCHIKMKFPYAQRVTAYGSVRDILRKSPEELMHIKETGLEMIYVGLESGDQSVLNDVSKNVTIDEMEEAGFMLKESGILLSSTLISGLGGKERLEEHALASARLITKVKPEYLGFLTLMLDSDAPIMERIKNGQLTLLSPKDVVKEMKIFLGEVDSEGTIFRANHASNYINLKGMLNRDIPNLIKTLDYAESNDAFKLDKYRML